ncbi:hypothetical protein HDU98_002222 [Podochytrium sp. JEL0797]|nr:hypothetical protein HDU98_002222 [Podochytrium sp. JEL0797]
MIPLFYYLYQDWDHTLAHSSDTVRQILFTLVVIVFRIVCHTAVKLPARGNPHCVVGARVFGLSTAGPTIQAQFSPLQNHTKGTLLDSSLIKKTYSPQNDLMLLLLGDNVLDTTKTYQLDPDTFSTTDPVLMLINFTSVVIKTGETQSPFNIHDIKMTAQNNQTGRLVPCLLDNVGCDGSPGAAGFASTTLTLKIFCRSDVREG